MLCRIGLAFKKKHLHRFQQAGLSDHLQKKCLKPWPRYPREIASGTLAAGIMGNCNVVISSIRNCNVAKTDDRAVVVIVGIARSCSGHSGS